MMNRYHLVEITPYRTEVCQAIKGLDVKIGDRVLIKSDEGKDLGRIIRPIDDENIYGLIMKIADQEMLDKYNELKKKAKQYSSRFEELIEQYDYPMKAIGTHYQFDEKRVIFYFTADHRIDFRKLHKVISKDIKKRTVIKQVGIRDYSKKFGGIGICGRELCCATFLKHFRSVSLRVAREQNLYFSPQKISGYCGKLMCCLQFEEELYREAREQFPSLGTKYKINRQVAEVVGSDVFSRKVYLKYKDGTEKVVDLKWLKQRKSLI